MQRVGSQFKHANRWSTSDRQAFRDGNRLRASSVPGRRYQGPSLDDWDEDELDRARKV